MNSLPTCWLMDAPACATDRRSMAVISCLARILPFITVLRWAVPWLVLVQMAAGFSHFRGLHSMPRAMISHTRSNMLVQPQAQPIELHLDNLRNCANFLFPQQPSTVQQFVDIVSGSKDFSSMVMCRPEPCPLLKHDALLIHQQLTKEQPTCVSAEDLQAMSSAIEKVLLPSHSLIDHDGRLTRTIYRRASYYGDSLQNALSLRPQHDKVVPGSRCDVHIVDFQDRNILYAQTKGENKRFSGLSASTSNSLPLVANLTVVATLRLNATNGVYLEANEWQIYNSIAASHPNHYVKLFASWKVEKGSHVANHSNWIVDHDGTDHVTIAANVDLEFDEYIYVSDAPYKLFLPELARDFPWVRDGEVQVVLVPQELHYGGGIMSPSLATLLNLVLRRGEFEELMSVMVLQDEINAHLASPQLQSLLHIYEHAHIVITNFLHGCEYGEYDQEEERAVRDALKSLNLLIAQVQNVARLPYLNINDRRRTPDEQLPEDTIMKPYICYGFNADSARCGHKTMSRYGLKVGNRKSVALCDRHMHQLVTMNKVWNLCCERVDWL